MAIRVETYVTCDKCQKEAGGFSSGEKASAREARAMARESGWKMTREKDFCSDCRKDIEAAVAEARKGNI